MKSSKTNFRFLAASMGIAAALSASAFAQVTTTISGPALQALTYNANGGVAQYVAPAAPTPALAELSTTDSGLNGGAPAVYIKAANIGLTSLGSLDNFSESYHLYGSSTGPTGAQPYWLTYLNDPNPGGGYIGVISMGGPDLNGSTPIHVIYTYDTSGLPSSNTYWGDSLSQLDNTTYGSTTFGQMTVYESGPEIGNWDNGTSAIPASANFDSFTVTVPEPASFSLLGIGALALLRRRRRTVRGC